MNTTTDELPKVSSIRAMGQRALPAMEKLSLRIPSLKSAVLCSADGFNLCALGVDAVNVGRLAALSTSLFTVGTSTVNALHNDATEKRELDMLSLTSGDMQVVGVKIPARHASYLVLMVEAQRTTLGVILVGTRSVAAELADVFA